MRNPGGITGMSKTCQAQLCRFMAMAARSLPCPTRHCRQRFWSSQPGWSIMPVRSPQNGPGIHIPGDDKEKSMADLDLQRDSTAVVIMDYQNDIVSQLLHGRRGPSSESGFRTGERSAGRNPGHLRGGAIQGGIPGGAAAQPPALRHPPD